MQKKQFFIHTAHIYRKYQKAPCETQLVNNPLKLILLVSKWLLTCPSNSLFLFTSLLHWFLWGKFIVLAGPTYFFTRTDCFANWLLFLWFFHMGIHKLAASLTLFFQGFLAKGLEVDNVWGRGSLRNTQWMELETLLKITTRATEGAESENFHFIFMPPGLFPPLRSFKLSYISWSARHHSLGLLLSILLSHLLKIHQALSIYSKLTHQMDTQLSKELHSNSHPPGWFFGVFSFFFFVRQPQ